MAVAMEQICLTCSIAIAIIFLCTCHLNIKLKFWKKKKEYVEPTLQKASPIEEQTKIDK